MQLKEEFLICKSLETTSGVIDDQEEMNNFTLARYAQAAHFLCSLKSSFTTLVNKRALHIISTPCVLHRYALAS